MSPLAIGALAVAECLAVAWLTAQVRRYALARRLLDIPNERSSHAVATPRGGGIAIVLIVLAVLLILGSISVLPWPHVCGLCGGGALVAGIGFIDDHGDLARRWRLLGHLLGSAWLLVWIGGVPPLAIHGTLWPLGWIGDGLALLYVIWLINLTNFMDGIDGIAGVEAVTVCLGGVVLVVVTAAPTASALMPVILASATAGFLVWNWPPAKIFMGDSGSGFLGLMLGGLSLLAGWVAPSFFWGWLILLGVFVVDATLTVTLRGLRGETFYKAHRSHAYQHAVRRIGAHLPVTVAVGAINICWLLPMAVLVALGRIDGIVGVAIAYAPLTATALWFGAGKKDA